MWALAQYPVPAVNRFDMELGSGYRDPPAPAADPSAQFRARTEGFNNRNSGIVSGLEMPPSNLPSGIVQDPTQVNQGTPTKFAQDITDYFRQAYETATDNNAGVSIAGYTAPAPKPPVEGPQDSGTPLYDQEGFDPSALVPAPPAAELAAPDTFGLSGESDGPGVNDWAENIALSFGTTGEAGPAVDTALTGLGVEPMKGLKERNDQMHALFKEMFGDTEEETAREKALMFALVGAAIANGTSSDALTNIAQGMSAGVNKMMENQASKSDKKQKLKYAAFNAALDSQQRADDRELSLLDASNARTNAFTDSLNLYKQKSRFDMENMTFLQSPQGKAMSADYDTNLAILQSGPSVYAAMVDTYGKEQMDKFMAARGMAPKTADTTEKTDAQIELEEKYGIFR